MFGSFSPSPSIHLRLYAIWGRANKSCLILEKGHIMQKSSQRTIGRYLLRPLILVPEKKLAQPFRQKVRQKLSTYLREQVVMTHTHTHTPQASAYVCMVCTCMKTKCWLEAHTSPQRIPPRTLTTQPHSILKFLSRYVRIIYVLSYTCYCQSTSSTPLGHLDPPAYPQPRPPGPPFGILTLDCHPRVHRLACKQSNGLSFDFLEKAQLSLAVCVKLGQ
jgi:hypothetical protein